MPFGIIESDDDDDDDDEKEEVPLSSPSLGTRVYGICDMVCYYSIF